VARSEPQFKIYPAGWFVLAVCILVGVAAFQADKKQAVREKTAAKTPAEDPYDQSDRILRSQYASWDEAKLRAELVGIGNKQLLAFDEPEPYVRKALIAEALTRYDGMRGTNHWNRAQAHFEEAIELWGHAKTEKMRKDRPRRVAVLHLYAAQACLQQGLFGGARAHLQEAEKYADTRDRARDALQKIHR
jgi:hypothetical protein